MDVSTFDATVVMVLAVLGFIGAIGRWAYKIYKDDVTEQIEKAATKAALKAAEDRIRELEGRANDPS
jgi:hypothetical protein